MRARPLLLALTILPPLLAALGGRPAGATPEGEWEIGAGVGPAMVVVDDRLGAGLLLGLEGQRGLGDVTSLRLGLAGSGHSLDAEEGVASGRVRAAIASAALVFALDIFRVVPFAEVGIGASHLSGTVDRPGLHLGLEGGLGLLFFLDPRWSLSTILRHQQGALRLTGDGSRLGGPGVGSLLLRLSRALEL